MEIAKHRLLHGAEFPYDATDKWWADDGWSAPPPAKDWAHAAARGIMADLCDRRGIKKELEGIDEEVRIEMVESISKIIRVAFVNNNNGAANES